MTVDRKLVSAWLGGAGVMALAIPTQVIAQDEGASGGGGNLVEIVVTAEKRGQNLQKTPLAISAVQSEELELRGLTETKDLSAIAPNVAVSGATTNATASVITIRGIPTPADETLGFDSPIGLYLDGVYLARSSASTFEVADIERVEVLRGPQGTLFGRNTTGGAINFITKLPSEEAQMRLRAGYGNYNAWNVRAILDTGNIQDSGLKMSLGYLHRQRDGVVDNILQPDKSRDPGGVNVDSARWALNYESGIVNLTNIFDYTIIKGVPQANQLAEIGNGVFRPNVIIDGATFAQVQPANVAGYLASATALEPQCGAPLASVSRTRLDSLCLDMARPSTDKLYGNLTRLELDFDSFIVRSSTAFRWWKNNIEGSDLDGLGSLRGPLFTNTSLFNGFPSALLQQLGFPAGTSNFLAATPVPTTTQSLFQARNERRQKQFSQELEIISNNDGDFQWVLGAFYFKESGYEFNPQSFAFILDTNQAVFSDAAFVGVLQGVGFSAQQAAQFAPLLAPSFRAANPAQFRAIPQSSTLGYNASARSIAVYGQATYRPGGPDGRLGVTLGLRYTWDRKEIDRFQNGVAPLSAAELLLNQRTASFSEPTGNLTIDYRASDDINLYARVARGYRSGGFNARQSTQLDNPATPAVNEAIAMIPFGSEKITSYEIGAKTEFFNRLRVNVALFYNIYKDQQTTVPIPIVGGGSFGTQIINAGKTNYTGVEVETKLAITDNLTADGSFGYVRKSVKQFPGADIAGATQNIADVIRPGNSPSTTASAGLTYAAPIGNNGTMLTVRGGWTYLSSQTMFANPLTAPFQGSTSSPGHGLFDAQIRIDNIRIGNNENALSLTIWGKNLTDKEYVSRGIDFGQLGLGSVIYGDPRTYGLTAEFTF